MLRICDLVAIQSGFYPADPDHAPETAINTSFVPTLETREVFRRIFGRLSAFPARQPGVFIFTGNPGVGKTCILRQMQSMLSVPSDPSWSRLIGTLPELSRPKQKINSLRICVPADPTLNLFDSLAGDLVTACGKDAQRTPEPGLRLSDYSSVLMKTAPLLAAQSMALVAIDGISLRFEGSNQDAIERDVKAYRSLCEHLAEAGILVILVADEKHIRQDRFKRTQAPLESLARKCDFVWLSRSNIAEIVGSKIARKTADQKSEIQKLLGDFRRKLTLMERRDAGFLELYPIHPAAFDAMFALRTRLRAFSPLEFCRQAIEAALDRPAGELITIADLFRQVLPALRGQPDMETMLAIYDELSATLIPQMSATAQSDARALLGAVTLAGICPGQPSNVRHLANALLLARHDENWNPYATVADLLFEMEHKGYPHLRGEGERLERSYYFQMTAPEDQRAARQSSNLSIYEASQIPIAAMMFDWMGSQVASWRADSSSTPAAQSQSLIIPAPGFEAGLPGLVHFKSIIDPPWGNSDLDAFDRSPFPWVLLILSPFERFYELESKMRRWPESCPKIFIWKPRRLDPQEGGLLRSLSVNYQNQKETGSPEARASAREIMASLYLNQGSLICRHGCVPFADEAAKECLSTALARHLGPMYEGIDTTSPHLQEESRERLRADQEKDMLFWASRLAGSDEMMHLDVNAASEKLREWIRIVLDPEVGLLSAKLHPMPVSLLTERFCDEVRLSEGTMERIEPVLQRFSQGDLPLPEAIAQLRRHFRDDIGLLQNWRDRMRRLASMARGLPAFEHAREYIQGVFPVPLTGLETLRRTLLKALDEPDKLLDPGEREEFESRFEEFKKGYIDWYTSFHLSSSQASGSEEEKAPAPDPVAMRNLELLSRLHHSDQSHIRKVRMIARWIRRQRCPLPVREILQRSPRCLCGFNPMTSTPVEEVLGRIEAVAQEGIHYFRTSLRSCSSVILQSLKPLRADEEQSRQVSVLLSGSAMIPLDERGISLLNLIIDQNVEVFRPAFRISPGNKG